MRNLAQSLLPYLLLALVVAAPSRALAQGAGTVRGRLVDAATGAPVMDVRVCPHPVRDSSDEPPPGLDRGEFPMGFQLLNRSRGLGPGRFDASDIVRHYPVDRFDLLVRAPGYEFAIERVPRQEGEVTIRLKPGQGFGARGRVVDRTSRAPVPSLELNVVVEVASHQGIVCSFPVVTDASGAFDVRSLPEGRAKVEVDEGGFDGHGRQFALTKTSREPAEVVIEVDRPASLRVEIRRPDGRLVRDVHVILREPGNVNAYVHPSSDGVYERPRLTPGKYQVRVIPGPRSEDSMGVFSRVAAVERDITLAPGQSCVEKIVLPEPGGALSIALTDEKGVPVASAWVRLSDGRQRFVSPFDQAASAITDASGVARFPGLAQGRYAVFVPDEGCEGTLVALELDATPLHVKIDLPPRLTLGGRVVDESGEPVEGATVHVYPAHGGIGDARTTDAKGRFQYSKKRATELSVSVDADGFQRFHDQLVNDGRDHTLVLVDGRRVVVRGSIGAGHPELEGAAVQASLAADGSYSSGAGVVRDGRFEVEFKGLGAYETATIAIRVASLIPVSRAIMAGESEIALDYPADRGRAVKGRLRLPEGIERENRHIFVHVEGAPLFLSVPERVAADGSFTIPGVSRDAVTIKAGFLERRNRETSVRYEARAKVPAGDDDLDLGVLQMTEELQEAR